MQVKQPPSGLSIVMKVTILVGAITALASLIVGATIINGTSDIVYKEALNFLKYETNITSLNLISDIENLRGDTRYLATTPPIIGIPRAIQNNGKDPIGNSDLSEWKFRLETIFSELIRAKSQYIQIRYIGIADGGKELIRVERRGNLIKVVDSNNLQIKGSKDYFKQSINLNPGQVYLTEISLNRDFGKISEPHTPVLRASTPIFFNNKPFGILVINMKLNDIFTQMIKETPRELIPYITNEDGYFLAHPNKAMTYGFEYGNNNTIQKIYKDFDLHRNTDLRDTQFTVKDNGDVIHVTKAYYDPLNEDRFLAIMIAASNKNLQSKSSELKMKSYTIMSLLVIISLIIASFLVRKLMRPLHLISVAADDLARGREVLNLPVQSGDEIGELARSFDDMRHQLEDKEHELITSQGLVHHANKMGSLGEMASGMAHEINSPIQTISLTAQRVQRQLTKGMTQDEIDSSMQGIVFSVKKISKIIDSLRRVSRSSTDDDFLETKLSDIINDVKHMTSERFKVNDVNFEVRYIDIDENTLIQCQRLQISQVLINLVNNAYDAIQELDDKWIKIIITTTSRKIQISVMDSGTGIPKKIINKLFEPMFTTKDIGKGTGLGLSISREIILKHNGLIFIDEGSKNTRFVIELPITHMT